MTSPIQSLVDNYYELNNFLSSQGMISELNEVNNHYRKILLLSCASYHENQIINIIQDFIKRNSDDDRVYYFLNNKAIQRQYHTLFDWESSNINKFLGLFGLEFKQKTLMEINDESLQIYIKAFLTIGNERNKMVHENFLEYKLEKTFNEIVILHNDAMKLIEYLQSKFCKY